jgi:hypothetical protein
MLMCVNCGDFDVSTLGERNAGQFQAESFGIRIAACGDQ